MGDEKMINKKGIVLIRNLLFMIVLFGIVMSLASLIVLDMANEYSNTNATNEYQADDISFIGEQTMGNIYNDTESMKRDADPDDEGGGLFGSFILNTIQGVGSILLTVFKAPVYIKEVLGTLLISLNVPASISGFLSSAILTIITVVIVFGVMTALLRGSKV